jgi:serine/threonine protein kinase
MSKESIPNTCPKCGGAIPVDAPQGLCPPCVLARAATRTESGLKPGERIAPPPIETVVAAFPQLEIIGLIGVGGMGVVYKARQANLDRLVALKLLPLSLGADPAFTERFQREARFLGRLNHPNIVSVFDFGQSGGFCFLLLELVDGVNLRQAMQAGRFSSAEALTIVSDICRALQYAHDQGVLHRDIKPENILLDARGRVKLADFGIAKLVREPGDRRNDVTLTQSGSRLGTLHYMAPEQIETPSEVDHRADIYSLGVVFYELLTGELPIGRFAPPSEKADLDARVDAIVFRALAKERELRQQSAGEVRTQVEELGTRAETQSSQAAASKPSALKAPLPAWARRIAVGLLLAGAIEWVASSMSVMGLTGSVHTVRSGSLPDLFGIYFASLLALTGVALFARNSKLRIIALVMNAAGTALGLLGLCASLLSHSLAPQEMVGNPGMTPHGLMPLSLSLLQFAGLIAGIWILCRRDLRPVFGLRPPEDSDCLPNPWPHRLYWLVLALVLLPAAALIAALVAPMLFSKGLGTAGGLYAALVPVITGAILGVGFVRTRPTFAEAKPRGTWNLWPRRVCVGLLALVVMPGLMLAIGLILPRMMAPGRNSAPPTPTVVSPRFPASGPNGEAGDLPQTLPPGTTNITAMKWHFAWKQLEENRKKAEVGLVAPRGPEILASERDLAVADAEFWGDPFGVPVANVAYAKAMLEITRRKFASGLATQVDVNQATVALAISEKALQELRSPPPPGGPSAPR